MLDYAWMCLNLTDFLHLPILIPSLKEPDCFPLRVKIPANIDFFYISWKYWILFFVLNRHVRLQILLPFITFSYYLLGLEGRKSWYNQPVIYPINISMMHFTDLVIYFFVVFFSLFGASKDLIRDSQRLWSCNFVRLSKKV